uniref:Ribonuclease H-like domain-containing protein n=1 Tax=Tanacetum cinerariifolium TaxID=118510 RepID=A0A699HA08_TANCI|nr:ribonuclease H-like domain-containing protein [Tanacetum cinerariifolium]
MPPRSDFGIDESMFTYGPKQFKTSESDAKTSNSASYESNSSVETLESIPKPVANEPKAVVLTKTGRLPINAARQTFSSQTASTSTVRKVNTAKYVVNEIRPRNNVYKSHSPIKRPFTRTTAPKDNFSYHKVNTAWDKIVSDVGGNREIAVKASADCNWRAKRHYWNKVSKYNSGSNSSKNAYLVDYQDYNGGPVAFGGSKGHITGKGKIRTGKLDFEDVCFVKELKHFNLLSVSQMCDKKNKVLFTDIECLVPSPDFKLPDENQVLLRVPRQNNIYSFNLENIVPTGGLACLIAKSTVDESNKCHRRLGHVNFKNLNKLVKGNLVKGLPSKIFQNNHNCVAFQKGKQHKASWIKREYNNARTPQQKEVTERKNRTLIEAATTMLADSFLPNTFWAEAVSTACYVINRVLVTKPQNKTPYELITGKILIISYIRPFGCHVTILNTIDHLGKFDGKSDEGFLVRYSLNSKAFKPVRSKNHANQTARPKEANHSTGTQDNIDTEAKNRGKKPKKDTSLKSNEKPVDQEEQAFLKELERLKRQEKETNDEAEALRKESAQGTENLLRQTGAARASSTNTVNTISTPVSTASPSRVFSASESSSPDSTIYDDQDDSHIPALEDIYDHPSNRIFSNASYDDEGAVVDFTNLEQM